MAKKLDVSVYNDIEEALQAKREFVKTLRLNFDENHRDIVENLGVIKALEEEYKKEKVE